MAALYMLHFEMYFPTEKPVDDDKVAGGVTTKRRNLLKRFGNWVSCQCGEGCHLEWNFANDIGLHRDKGGSQKKCGTMKLFQELSFKDLSVEKEKGVLELTREVWMNSRA